MRLLLLPIESVPTRTSWWKLFGFRRPFTRAHISNTTPLFACRSTEQKFTHSKRRSFALLFLGTCCYDRAATDSNGWQSNREFIMRADFYAILVWCIWFREKNAMMMLKWTVSRVGGAAVRWSLTVFLNIFMSQIFTFHIINSIGFFFFAMASLHP